jgi:hypothetical protein
MTRTLPFLPYVEVLWDPGIILELCWGCEGFTRSDG